jgi:hypothetical protein
VRAVEADVLPTCLRHGMGVMSYSPLTGGWLSGRWRKDAGQQASSRAERLPERFDLANPFNQRKLDAVEQLTQLAEETGITLIQLAIAFVLNHPRHHRRPRRAADHGAARIAARGGRRACSRRTRCSTASTRSCRPGITINPADNSYANPALESAARRRVALAIRPMRRLAGSLLL